MSYLSSPNSRNPLKRPRPAAEQSPSAQITLTHGYEALKVSSDSGQAEFPIEHILKLVSSRALINELEKRKLVIQKG